MEGLVADVVRHLKALDFVNISSDVGILTNSATLKFNCAEALGLKDNLVVNFGSE
jgi:hypothetical protein